jgi:hypothetical protein
MTLHEAVRVASRKMVHVLRVEGRT